MPRRKFSGSWLSHTTWRKLNCTTGCAIPRRARLRRLVAHPLSARPGTTPPPSARQWDPQCPHTRHRIVPSEEERGRGWRRRRAPGSRGAGNAQADPQPHGWPLPAPKCAASPPLFYFLTAVPKFDAGSPPSHSANYKSGPSNSQVTRGEQSSSCRDFCLKGHRVTQYDHASIISQSAPDCATTALQSTYLDSRLRAT